MQCVGLPCRYKCAIPVRVFNKYKWDKMKQADGRSEEPLMYSMRGKEQYYYKTSVRVYVA